MFDWLAVPLWWLLAQLFGLAVWPLASRLFHWLPDRGCMLTKPLGLLLVSYTLWLLASLRLMPNTLAGIVVAWLLVAGLNWLPGLRRSSPKAKAALTWPRENRAIVLAYEVLFVVALVGWAVFRAHAPDITSGEKPMELAFINAIGRSAYFPPHDPWLAGYPIAYYYFGYVMLSMFKMLSGVTTGLAFSLGGALWFALAAASIFGIVANLVLLADRQARRAAATFGALGAVMLVLLGSFEAPLEVAHSAGLGSADFWTNLDVLDLNQPPTPPSSGQVAWPLRSDEGWWWRAAQLIHDYPPDAVSPSLANVLHQAPDPNTVSSKTITEFPQFSFLLGDLHPQTLNLPFVLLAIGLAVNAYQAAREDRAASLRHMPQAAIYPVVLGGLGFLNTWDFPIYACLVVSAFGLGRWQSSAATAISRRLIELTGLGLLGVLFYLPFYSSFSSQVAGVWPNIFNGTRLSHFLIMFGPFAVIGAVFGVRLLTESIKSGTIRPGRYALASIRGGMIVVLLVAIAAGAIGLIAYRLSPSLRIWFDGLLVEMAQRGITLETHLLARLTNAWLPVLLGIGLVGVILMIRAQRSRSSDMALLLFLFGLLLTFGVEFGYIVDVFNTRMNTLFKFYYQVWVLWSVASAHALYHVWSGPQRIRTIPARVAVGAVLGGAIALGLAYPTLAIATRATSPAPALDAMRALAESSRSSNAGDAYAVAEWLNRNVTGVSVILERSEEGVYSPAQSRISSWTGLPTLVGWPGHEAQWRGDDAVQRVRLPDIDTIYATPVPAIAMRLLRQYGVEYVFVGHRERQRYPAESLAKFDQMFPIVFQRGAATVYHVGRELPD